MRKIVRVKEEKPADFGSTLPGFDPTHECVVESISFPNGLMNEPRVCCSGDCGPGKRCKGAAAQEPDGTWLTYCVCVDVPPGGEVDPCNF